MFSDTETQLFIESNCYNDSWHGLAPTTSSLLNTAQAWFGDSIGQRPTPAGNLFKATLSRKQMWVQATLCQLASELESGHRHVLYR